MKLSLLAFSTNTGLGIQTLEFYNHMKPHKVLVSDLSRFNKVETHHERYFQPRITNGIPTNEDMEWLTDDVDVVFICETPLNYHLYRAAKQKKVAVVQQYNYEFLDYFRKPNETPPTVLAAPSTWNTNIVDRLGIAPVMDWPVPVNRKLVPFREIKECKTFVHLIGRPAVHDRNGTLSFLKAAIELGDQFKYKIFLQPPTDEKAKEYFEPVRAKLEEAKQHVSIEIIENTPNYQDIYASGDVMVIPRRYGGLCLPAQEALSAGIPVIMTDLPPNNSLLPREWLGAAKQVSAFTAHTAIPIHEIEHNELVGTMRQFEDNEFMRVANEKANEIAESLSWKTLASKYEEWLKESIKLARQ